MVVDEGDDRAGGAEDDEDGVDMFAEPEPELATGGAGAKISVRSEPEPKLAKGRTCI